MLCVGLLILAALSVGLGCVVAIALINVLREQD